MPRKRLLLLVAIVVIAVVVPADAALAGGGCHAGPTRGTGDTVEMEDACFTPSTLQVEPGTTVTFINQDDFDHNVNGMGWSSESRLETMIEGSRFSVAFDEEGIYAYACTIHPGMTGSIVVGDGDGPGNGAVVVASDDNPGTGAVTSTPVQTEEGGWLVPAAIALVVGAALGFGLASARRRTRRVSAGAEHLPSAT